MQVEWKGCPVEAARLFDHRLQCFLDAYVLCETNPIFGRITEHVVRLECQGRGSLHAHILLWVHPDHQEWVRSTITATAPGDLALDGQNRLRPSDPQVLYVLFLLSTRCP
jgi:hypothetical protein